MFYKIIDEHTVEKFKNPLIVEGKHTFTNSRKLLNENGYYRLVDTEYPQDDKFYKTVYKLENNVIIKGWTEIEDTRTFRERVVSRIREVYSVDDELAILRQRYTKPEEFAEYNAFVEQIKVEERRGVK